MSTSSDESSSFSENENISNFQMAPVITPNSSAKFNHSISLIFNGFFDMYDHPRDPVNWSAFQVEFGKKFVKIFIFRLLNGSIGYVKNFQSMDMFKWMALMDCRFV